MGENGNGKTAGDVIPIKLMRGILQDKPVFAEDIITIDGVRSRYQLENSPIMSDEETFPVTVKIEGIAVPEYTVNYDDGIIKFDEPPDEGEGQVNYYHAQLSDKEIESMLDYALLVHDPEATWDDFPPEYAPYVQWLAAASGLYMLSTRWATKMRLRVETVETHDHQVAGRYFDLARRMEQRYNDANAGLIKVAEFTRRDVQTGILVPFTEDFYIEQ